MSKFFFSVCGGGGARRPAPALHARARTQHGSTSSCGRRSAQGDGAGGQVKMGPPAGYDQGPTGQPEAELHWPITLGRFRMEPAHGWGGWGARVRPRRRGTFFANCKGSRGSSRPEPLAPQQALTHACQSCARAQRTLPCTRITPRPSDSPRAPALTHEVVLEGRGQVGLQRLNGALAGQQRLRGARPSSGARKRGERLHHGRPGPRHRGSAAQCAARQRRPQGAAALLCARTAVV